MTNFESDVATWITANRGGYVLYSVFVNYRSGASTIPLSFSMTADGYDAAGTLRRLGRETYYNLKKLNGHFYALSN